MGGIEVAKRPEQQTVQPGERASHIISFTPFKALCGSWVDSTEVIIGDPPAHWEKCVVCWEIWHGMPENQREALNLFWKKP